jgi:CRISPR/Cas system-associated exonuclease Cas4 (RecB family)
LIKATLANFAAMTNREFSHDRANTIGASEVGACLRKTWFTKNETPHDPGYIDRYGARLRGNLIEDHYVVPALRKAYGDRFHMGGDQQSTVVDGYLSATPDGVIVGVERDCLADLGVPDIGDSSCIAIEIKSIDPRAELNDRARPQHTFQTQVQMGLLRAHTPYKPDYALISYIDASFLDEVTEFPVAFDPSIFAAAHYRAEAIMVATDPQELWPEGKLAGGAECRFCPYASHCAAVTVSGIPREEHALGDNVMAEFKALHDQERSCANDIDQFERELGAVRQAIKDLLRTNGVRRVHGDGWSIDWSPVKGRQTVDLKAIEADGFDLDPYRKQGDAGERLTVK